MYIIPNEMVRRIAIKIRDQERQAALALGCSYTEVDESSKAALLDAYAILLAPDRPLVLTRKRRIGHVPAAPHAQPSR
jgi:hypothetical protein